MASASISSLSTPSGLWKKTKHLLWLIDIEPSLLIHMTVTLMGNLHLSNLLLYKTCTVNLGWNDTFCQELVDKPSNASDESTEEIRIQEHISEIQVWSSIIENSFPILYVIFLGAWSDTFGRKLPYLICISGYIVRYGLLLLATYFTSWNAEVVAVVNALPMALTGSRTAVGLVIYSYVSDTTSMRDRTLKMGMVTAIRVFGKSLGSALGGYLSEQKWNYYMVFGLAGALDLVGFFYVLVFLKDTRDTERLKGITKWQEFKSIFNLRHIKDSAEAFFKKRQDGNRVRLFLIVIAFTCATMPIQAEDSLLYNFTRLRLGWDAGNFGYFNTYRMILGVIGGIASVVILSRAMKVPDAIIGVLSSISQFAGSFIFCFATSDWMMYLAPLVDILNGTMIIASRSMISKIIPRHETGKVNSFIGVVETVSILVSGPMYNALYRVTLNTFIGAIFLLSAAITIPALLVFIFLSFFQKQEDRDPNLSTSVTKNESRKRSVEVTHAASFL